MDAIDVLKHRRSVRKYLPKPVEKGIIEDIVDCGRLAATGRNVQPWVFVVVTDEQRRKDISQMAPNGSFIKEAPVCIVVFCEDTKYLVEDGSAATQNILLAAKAHGLGSCWIAGHKKQYSKAIETYLSVPDNYKLISLVALGYAKEEAQAPKKALKQVLHWEEY